MAQLLPQGPVGVPTVEEIIQALLKAAQPLDSLTEAQRPIAALLQRPESNKVVFDVVARPWLAGVHGFFGDTFQWWAESEFYKEQGLRPGVSFLATLASGESSFFSDLGVPGFPTR